MIVTLMKKKFVDEYHWIEENEMLDLVAIAQSSPGAIAVNGAIVVGYLQCFSEQFSGKSDAGGHAGRRWRGNCSGGL